MTELESVMLTRHFPIAAERLYDILTQPSYMEQWFSPAPEIKLTILKHEATIGAPYEFAYQMPDGEQHLVVGEYCALKHPNLIAFTWGWAEPDPHAGISTLVTLTLRERGGETELTVLHEQLHTGDMADRHRAGWASTLDRLDTLAHTLKKEMPHV